MTLVLKRKEPTKRWRDSGRVQKTEGEVCALCDSVFLSLGWQDTHGALVTYCKEVRDEAIHAKFIIARKKVIQTRLEHAASGLTLKDSPSRAST